jgi:hypothetical protein
MAELRAFTGDANVMRFVIQQGDNLPNPLNIRDLVGITM